MESVVKLDNWDKYNNVVHGYSTRFLGNLSRRTGNLDEIEKRRLMFANEMGINWDDVLLLPISHSNTIALIESAEDVVRDELGVLSVDEATVVPATHTVHHSKEWQSGIDGVIVTVPNVFPVVLSGDCVVVSLYDPATKIIGFAHAGVIGVVNNIVPHVIKTMSAKFNVNSTNIEVTFSPSIRSCCYTLNIHSGWKKFNADLKSYYGDDYEHINNGVDMHGWLKKQLIEEGVQEQNIHDTEICTACGYDNFFSNYAAKTPERKKQEGRFATVVGMRE